MQRKASCLIGQRNIPADTMDSVRWELEQEINTALEDGYRTFITEFAQGVGMCFARCIKEKREQYPDIFFESILATTAHAEKFTRDEWELLSKSDGLRVLCDKCQQDYALVITRYLVEQASRVIIVHGDEPDSDILYAMDYAHTMERDLRIIRI